LWPRCLFFRLEGALRKLSRQGRSARGPFVPGSPFSDVLWAASSVSIWHPPLPRVGGGGFSRNNRRAGQPQPPPRRSRQRLPMANTRPYVGAHCPYSPLFYRTPRSVHSSPPSSATLAGWSHVLSVTSLGPGPTVGRTCVICQTNPGKLTIVFGLVTSPQIRVSISRFSDGPRSRQRPPTAAASRSASTFYRWSIHVNFAPVLERVARIRERPHPSARRHRRDARTPTLPTFRPYRERLSADRLPPGLLAGVRARPRTPQP